MGVRVESGAYAAGRDDLGRELAWQWIAVRGVCDAVPEGRGPWPAWWGGWPCRTACWIRLLLQSSEALAEVAELEALFTTTRDVVAGPRPISAFRDTGSPH